MSRVLELPLVTVQAWVEPVPGATDEPSVRASRIAGDCRHALLNDYTSMPLVRGVEEVTGLYFDPDPGTGIDRYTFSIQLRVRAKR